MQTETNARKWRIAMGRVSEWLKYWGQLLLLPIYGISFLFPRDKRLWLFGSSFGKRFADNPRYLYLYAHGHREELGVRPVWISHDKQIVAFLQDNGYEAYAYHSFRGIWLALRAKVYFFDNYVKDINFWQSGGALKVNLWHGTGNKKINYDNRFDLVRHPRNLWERWKYFPRRLSDEKPSHYVLASSEEMAVIFAGAFRVDLSHVIVDGYPRNDALFENGNTEFLYTNEEKNIINQINEMRESGKKIIVYMPTFRQSETKFFECVDLDVFNGFLAKNNFMFYTKLHPKSKLSGEFEKMDYSNIKNISPIVDSYCILGMADMLTTDYSSVYTDFLLLNRPSVLFTYDLEEYSTDARDCYFDYDSYIPELRTYTMTEFMDGIKGTFQCDETVTNSSEKRKVSKEKGLYECGRLKLRDRMWKYTDGESSRRIIEKVMALLGD